MPKITSSKTRLKIKGLKSSTSIIVHRCIINGSNTYAVELVHFKFYMIAKLRVMKIVDDDS